MSDTMSIADPRLADAQPRPAAEVGGLPRVLAGIPAQGAMGLERHIATHGELPSPTRPRRRAEAPLLALLQEAGLLGRGGAGFPIARKLRAVAAAGRRPVVVVNGAEGEPASMKDRTLLQSLPHLVLDGAELAAATLGASEVIVAVCRSFRPAAERVAGAIAERRTTPARGAPVSLAVVPDHYLAGQEAALINCLNGGPVRPTFTPPLPFQQGVDRRPTLVSNVETLAHLALIARHGASWFRALGTPSQPGSALVTLAGPVAHPGVYEIEYGASLPSLIDAAGGLTGEVRAALVGGYGGSWIGGGLLDTVALSDEHLAPHGAAVGAGVVLLLSAQACPVAETARIARWLSSQSSGQCGPCVRGLDALAGSLAQIAAGGVAEQAMQRVARLTSLVQGRGACRHPDGAVEFILSAVDTFAAEFADHARHGRCEACARPAEMPLPHPAPEQARERPSARA